MSQQAIHLPVSAMVIIMPCIVNAANEVVVASFLKDGISFLGMSDVIEKTMERVAFIANPTYDDYVATDAEARKIAASLI